MKNPRFWIRISGVLWLLFGAVMVLCQESASSAETVFVDKSFNGREIKVRMGAIISVTLQELGTAGYEWKIQSIDGDFFEIIDTKITPSETGLEGAANKKTWLIRPKKEGKSELKFLHGRSWEDANSASDRFALKIRIVPQV